MHWTNSLHHFATGSRMHLTVGLGLIVSMTLLVLAGKHHGDRLDSSSRTEGQPASGTNGFRTILAAAILFIWTVSFARDLLPDRLSWTESLPLHICDVVGLIAPVALLSGRRSLRSILHFWGLGFCSQAFLWPVLRMGPAHVDFWMYWLGHGAIVAAAVYDIAVLGFRPTWPDCRIAVRVGIVFIVIVACIDALLGANYGYLGDSAVARGTLIAKFGPWPDRLPILTALSVALMVAMTLAWETPQVLRRVGKIWSSLPQSELPTPAAS